MRVYFLLFSSALVSEIQNLTKNRIFFHTAVSFKFEEKNLIINKLINFL